ncbi:hypothetical protein KCP74_09360 [Salmonella enterica subsp. enterica]|nr:hypothetical protein KCP74_09360 [Salmonella enterica subsp. enterica]
MSDSLIRPAPRADRIKRATTVTRRDPRDRLFRAPVASIFRTFLRQQHIHHRVSTLTPHANGEPHRAASIRSSVVSRNRIGFISPCLWKRWTFGYFAFLRFAPFQHTPAFSSSVSA